MINETKYLKKIINLADSNSLRKFFFNFPYEVEEFCSEYEKLDLDFIITVCDHANETCPNFNCQNAVRLHQNFFDPSSDNTENNWKKLFQKSRDEIKLYCLNFCKKYFNLEKLAE